MQQDMLAAMQEVSEGVVEQVSAAMEELEGETNSAVESLKKEMTERKRLHNLVLDLKGNIRVFCRARPPSQHDKTALTFASETELLCDVSGKSHPFSYDCVFGPQSQQVRHACCKLGAGACAARIAPVPVCEAPVSTLESCKPCSLLCTCMQMCMEHVRTCDVMACASLLRAFHH